MEEEMELGEDILEASCVDRFTTRQKIDILREAFLGNRSLGEILDFYEITEKTFYLWKKTLMDH